MHLHKSVFFFPLRTGCQGDNGEQENLGLRGPFPFSHTLPQKSRLFLTSSFQIAAWGGGWWWLWGGSSVSVLQGEFVIPSSLKNDSSLLFSFLHSSTAMTPFRARLEQDVVEIFCFLFGIFLLLLLTCFTLFAQHQGNMTRNDVTIFIYGTDGWFSCFLPYHSGGKLLSTFTVRKYSF